MEHSVLHGLQLLGLVVAGGAIWWSLLASALGLDAALQEAEGVIQRSGRWAAWTAAVATLLDLFVQVAELEGRTVFGGVAGWQVWEYVTGTRVGELGFARAAVLTVLGWSFSLRGTWARVGTLLVYSFALLLAALVSHAAAQPTNTELAVTFHCLHLAALSLWIGVVLQLWLQRSIWAQPGSSATAVAWATLLHRFSALALAGSSAAFASGVVAAIRYVPSLRDFAFSAYGLTLALKLVLLLPLGLAGAYNFSRAVPQLRVAASALVPQAWHQAAMRFQRALEIEATTAVLVIIVAGILGSVSPPGTEGSVTLTPQQIAALTTPKLPPTAFVDPNLFVDSPERNRFDLLYSEFMHNWSGVGVIAMGFLWLLQGGNGMSAVISRALWPWFVILFAGFISLFADPEVFVLRRVGLWEAISDPVVLEHQIGAVLVLWFLWLARRDSRRPLLQRPLGPTLPLLMIFGSLLLLGHAHASVRTTQELTNLINVQHAVFGSLGLIAGIIRWFDLRGLIPHKLARIAWPLLVILLGMLMAFTYREAL